ncbi:MAG: hypothetical protein ACKOW3_01775 [Hyphomicrobium sp.]
MSQLNNKETSSVSSQDPSTLAGSRKQRMRSLVIAIGLGFLVLLFYLATIVRLGGNVLNRPI